MKEKMKRFYWRMATKQLDGVGVIEIILILVIIIGLILIFRNQISAIINNAFKSIGNDTTKIGETIVVPTIAVRQ